MNGENGMTESSTTVSSRRSIDMGIQDASDQGMSEVEEEQHKAADVDPTMTMQSGGIRRRRRRRRIRRRSGGKWKWKGKVWMDSVTPSIN